MSGQNGDAIVDPRQAPALDGARDNETTPLLNGQPKATSGDAEGQPHDGPSENQEQTVLADDVTGPKLWLILSSAYVGVFLGAIDSTIIATTDVYCLVCRFPNVFAILIFCESSLPEMRRVMRMFSENDRTV